LGAHFKMTVTGYNKSKYNKNDPFLVLFYFCFIKLVFSLISN